MDYVTIKEAAEKWGISGRAVTYHCVDGRIPGVRRFGREWMIPKGAEKPDDRRKTQYQKPGRDHLTEKP